MPPAGGSAIRGLCVLAWIHCAGCGTASPGAETPPATPVELVTVGEPEPTATPVDAPSRGDLSDIDECVTVPASRAAQLDAQVQAAQKAVLEGQFRDAGAIAELARLQLWRDSPGTGKPDGPSDAGQAMLNAKRATAVDRERAEVRLVLAMALGRALLGLDDGSPIAHRLRLHLVQTPARQARRASPAGSFARAASGALLGHASLEIGDVGEARAAFEEATRSFPDLVTAWIGLGDAARAASDFDVASQAYRRALTLAPDDAAIRTALAASQQSQSWSVKRWPSPPAMDALGEDALAPPRAAPTPCPAAARAHTASGPLCKGVDALAVAKTASDRDAAAQQILQGFDDLRPLCESGDAACGPFVAPALASASDAFDGAGFIAKSIATHKLLLRRADQLPEAKKLLPSVTLEIADRYYVLAIYDQAAQFYEQHVALSGASPTAPSAAARARAMRAALGVPKALVALGEGASRGESRRGRPVRSRRLLCAVRRLASEKGWP